MSFPNFKNFDDAREGNVAMLFGLVAIPVVFAMGMGLDYTNAARLKDRLDAASDAAALSALTPTMRGQPAAVAQAAALAMFNAEVGSLRGLASAPSVTITVQDQGVGRTVNVAYTASAANVFTGLYGIHTTSLSGGAGSAGQINPNIDYYLLLDTSPSMAIAATTAGIDTMVAATPSQGGCAFGCHELNPAGDNLGNPGGVDNYTLARNLGVPLRIDNVKGAVAAMTQSATKYMATNNAQYRMAIYTFDINFSTVIQLNSNMNTVSTASQNIEQLTVWQNGWLTSHDQNNDTDTDFSSAMTEINGIMPSPGTGALGSTPQEVLFIVTDGVEDANVAGSRVQALMDTSFCATVKNRGIRIAVLYTEYFPLPTNAWYNTWIAPFQPSIGPNLQACASPGLFFEVTTDQDIAQAMNTLFTTTIQTAPHLTN
ncbi:MAG TPA: pilus assembly protein TadG-related protein [Methylocystis sp.]|nr:pilus assembly protein TadG-related protein [Methylocystis sp.]